MYVNKSCIYLINIDPTLKIIKDNIQASAVVYPIVNNAHFIFPDSRLIEAITAIQGKYISVNIKKDIEAKGVNTVCPIFAPESYLSLLIF